MKETRRGNKQREEGRGGEGRREERGGERRGGCETSGCPIDDSKSET